MDDRHAAYHATDAFQYGTVYKEDEDLHELPESAYVECDPTDLNGILTTESKEEAECETTLTVP